MQMKNLKRNDVPEEMGMLKSMSHPSIGNGTVAPPDTRVLDICLVTL